MKTVAVSVFTLLSTVAVSVGQHTQSLDAALKEMFPDSDYDGVTYYLSEEEQHALEEKTGGRVNPVIHAYQIRQAGSLAATVYLDQHRVRTLPETLMVSVLPDQQIGAVRLLSFKEPREYIPPDRWYEQLHGQHLHDGLALHRDIHAVTGATLTAQATVRCARRILAIHALLNQKDRRP